MYIVFLGAPGAGKGTQAARVAEKLNMIHIASGDLLRQSLEKGKELAQQVRSYMEQGKLVPNDITMRLVMARLSLPDSSAGVIFDGFPRDRKQAEALDRALVAQGKMIDKAVYIKVSENELLRRLNGRWICRECQTPYHIIDSPPMVQGKCDKCGGELYQRPDDKVETARKRLKVYFSETVPLIEYYKQAGKLLEVDGEGSVDKVMKRMLAALHWEFAGPRGR